MSSFKMEALHLMLAMFICMSEPHTAWALQKKGSVAVRRFDFGSWNIFLQDDSSVEATEHLESRLYKREAEQHFKAKRELDKSDLASTILDEIEKTQRDNTCSNLDKFDHILSRSISHIWHSHFTSQTEAVLRTATILNNLFVTPWSDQADLYNHAFFESLASALLHEEHIYKSVIAFDAHQFQGRSGYFAFAPMAIWNKSSGYISVHDLANKIGGYDWFRNHSNRVIPYRLSQRTASICRSASSQDSDRIVRNFNLSSLIAVKGEGLWSPPHYDCKDANSWVITYSAPFYGCDYNSQSLRFKGVVALIIDLQRLDINQCSDQDILFGGSHRCHQSNTQCVHVPGMGLHRGAYRCECSPTFYFPNVINSDNRYYNGSDVEKSYILKLHNKSNLYDASFNCLPCAEGCAQCMDKSSCYVTNNVMIRGIPLGIQSFCMTISVVLGFVILRLRKTKVMKASMWVMLEIILCGALLLYATVVIQYFEPCNLTCLIVPWLREMGFAIIYGALILKVYRVLAEFQSRKAHRVLVKDKDLLKYLSCIVLVVVGYMAAWTAVNLDHIQEGDEMLDYGNTTDNLKYVVCKAHWWDYVIEIAEFLFLCFGIYMCYCVRAAPSDYLEARYISWAIYNETVISVLLHISRHVLWLSIHPDYIFVMFFVRCQLTVTVTLILVLGPKLWYAHRPPEDDRFRGRTYSTADVHDSILPESMKLHVGVNSNGDVDVGEINLTEMDPEDIRAELKRLYTQLQIFKTKTMRKDNPHISKRRGGRKHTHRRFSLQAFHHKHRHHHEHGDHETELSKTPEESTNSAEGVPCSMAEESVCSISERENRTPTVTFKSGHKSII